MRKLLATVLILGPMLAACSKIEEPIVPELKGKWGAPGISEVVGQKRQAQVQQTSTKKDSSPTTHEEVCRVAGVTFGKSAIRVNAFGRDFPLFHIDSVKREGARIVLTGQIDKKHAGTAGKIELVMRNGEVRFDDVYDSTGRSIKYERIPDDDRVRSFGATTVGEGMKLFLDAKPCAA